jgi:hypothetical protein
MARQFERYRFRDGETRLDETTFNRIFADLDLRLAAMEALAIDWQAAITLVSDQGLTRVAAAMSGPLADLTAQVSLLQAQIEAAQEEGMLLDGPGTVSDSNLGDRTIDDTAAPGNDTGPLTTLLSSLANRVKAITGGATWRATPATTLAALVDGFAAATSHVANRANPHQVTPAQVGAAPVGGSSAQVYQVADATADTHAVNRRTGDGRYLRQTGGSVTGALTTTGSVTLAAGATLGGALAAGNQPLAGVKTLGYHGLYDNGNSGSSKTITLANGAFQKCTLTADNATLTISTADAAIGAYTILLVNTSISIDRVYFSANLNGRWTYSSNDYVTPRTGSGALTWLRLWWTGSELIGEAARVGSS